MLRLIKISRLNTYQKIFIKSLFMFILFNFIGIVANAQINNLEGLVKKNEEAVVLIECFNNDNVLISTGSGVIINKNGEVLTNVHVIK